MNEYVFAPARAGIRDTRQDRLEARKVNALERIAQSLEDLNAKLASHDDPIEDALDLLRAAK